MPVSPINRRNTTASPQAANVALVILSRHQVRRRQRVPTVTVMAGRNDAPSRLVRQWAESEKRPVRELSSIEQTDAVSSWFSSLVDSRNVTAVAYAWLAERAGCDINDLGGLPTRSPREQAMFLDVALGAKNLPPADAVCRAIVEQSCQNGSTTDGLWPRLLDACGGDLFRAVSGIIALVGEEGIPVLHAATRSGDVGALRSILGRVTSLVSIVPTLPVVVTTAPERLEEYLASTPECRSLALVREGVIWLAEDTISTTTTPGGATPGTGPAVVASQAGGASNGAQQARAVVPATLAQNHEAGAPVNSGLTRTENEARQTDDPARGAAERYLYERLQTHPETKGLFELNGCLELAGQSCEVDLLARGPKVAVEIDGFYHFVDLDAYRRHRRKDIFLQHAGYFVIRCLADDVASKLEEILDAVIGAVRREPVTNSTEAGEKTTGYDYR